MSDVPEVQIMIDAAVTREKEKQEEHNQIVLGILRDKDNNIEQLKRQLGQKDKEVTDMIVRLKELEEEKAQIQQKLSLCDDTEASLRKQIHQLQQQRSQTAKEWQNQYEEL